MMVNITVTIPGKPFPCPRPRWGQGRTFMPAAYEDWLNGARMLIRNAAVTQNGGRLIHGPLRVQLTFIGAHGSSDIDNLVKSVLDASNGQVFKDDKQVTHIEATKVDAETKSLRLTEIEFSEI